MRKTYLYIVLLVSFFAGCRKDDARIFSESADARLNKLISSYQSQLTSAANGWKGTITPGNHTTYNFYFRFNDSNRVVMFADIDSNTSAIARESSYRLKALQQPSLVFDTYSYLHQLSDPDPNVIGGDVGAGLSSDFEFAFDKAVGDTIKLIGRVNGTKLNLVKATAREAADWQNKNWAKAITSLQSYGKILNYFKRLTLNGIQYEVAINQLSRTVVITWVDAGGVTRTFVSGYHYSPTPSGITFNTPFNTGNGIIPGIYGITFNAGTTSLDVNLGGNLNGNIAGAIKPISTDLAAPARWWNQSVSQDFYWISFDGFTVNGVPDAYGVHTIPNFRFLLYWAHYGVSGSINYDLLGFVIGNSLSYGPAFRTPTFTTDGRIIFPFLGTLGTVPPNVAPVVTATRTMMADAAGFYLVQTSENSYDMVSAKDAKAWITWYWFN